MNHVCHLARNPRCRSLLSVFFTAALAVTGGLLCLPAQAAFTASTDRTQLAAGDSVQLTLQSDRGGSKQPALAPLEKDFEILERSTSSSLQIVNGSLSSKRQIRLVLAPRRSGRIEVPPLQWDGETSAAIELSVAANGARAGGSAAGTGVDSAAHVFITTSLDSLQPFVQSAVSLKVQLYSDKKLYQASVDLPGNADVLVRRIGQDATTQETRNGRPYQVITRHYLLVPQRSGEIVLDGPVLNAQVADVNGKFDPVLERLFGQLQIEGGLSGTRPLRLRSDAIKLVAQPRPPAWRSSDWLPAQQLTLEDAWRPADLVITVGQPLTRQLRIAAVGLSASQLPDLSALTPTTEGLKAHAEAAQLSDEVQDGHIVGQRDQDITLLADQPGRYPLPELRLAWWDVVSNQRREAVLPAVTVEVVAAVAGNTTTASPTRDAQALPGGAAGAASVASQTSAASDATTSPSPTDPASPFGGAVPWVWLSGVFAVLWLGTLGAWAWLHRRRQRAGSGDAVPTTQRTAAPSAAQARSAFHQACRNHAAATAREALLSWARATWPHAAPLGLNALARRQGNPALTELLRELDRACLTGTLTDNAWNGNALARALPVLDGGAAPPQSAHELPGLYSDPPR